MTITRMTASKVVEGLRAIFSLTATATPAPAPAEAVQEVGLALPAPLGPEQLRQLLMLGDITHTQVTLQGAASSIRVVYSAPAPKPAQA